MSNEAARQDDDSNNAGLLEKARFLFGQEDLEGSFILSKEHWLNSPSDLSAVQLLCEIVRKNGKNDLYKHMKILAQSQNELENNVQSMFEAGYHFIDAHEPELAVMLLGRCAKLLPQQIEIHYELGFALMQLRRFQEAITEFELLMQHDDDFDTRLNLTVCHSLTRNLERARQLACELERFASSQEEKKELALRYSVIKRLETFGAQDNLTVRDWFYSLYGSVLLGAACLENPAKNIACNYADIAETLISLSGLVKELNLSFAVIEYYSLLSRPLAEALAWLMGIKAQPYGGTAQKQKALLVMCRASDIIGPHKSFVQHSPCRTLFAYSLPVRTQLPVTPDIIGCLFSQCLMPWAQELDNHFKDLKEEQKTKQHPLNQIQENATREILSSVESLQSNNLIKKRIEDLHDYYNLKKPLLVLDNACSFPERPEYTAEIPF